MYWSSSESQPPAPPAPLPQTLAEERIPIIARRRSSGEIEVLRWCSRARPRVNTNAASDSRPVVTSPLSAVANDSNSKSGSVITASTTAARRNLSLPWTNRRLLPGYTAPVSPGWSATSSSDDESSDEEEDSGSYRPFAPNYNTFSSSSSSTYYNDTPSSSAADDEENGSPFVDSDSMILLADEITPLVSLPNKSQLLILALCRLSEPLVQISVVSYFYYYLPTLVPDRSLTPGETAGHVGILASSFLGFQWHSNRVLDSISDSIGRKFCILIGLAGSAISILGFGFSESLIGALFWCVIGGVMSGNASMLKAMVMETLDDEKHQSRALSLLPMCRNVGIVTGAILGGLLADPAGTWPDAWGGVEWAVRWKFALPSIVIAGILSAIWIVVVLFLKETPEKKKSRSGWGIEVRRKVQGRIRQVYGSFKGKGKYLASPSNDDLKGDYTTVTITMPDDEESALPSSFVPSSFTNPTTPPVTYPPPLRALLPAMASNFHIAAFPFLLAFYLSTPRPTGLDLPASTVGLAIAYMGLIALTIQLLPHPSLSPNCVRYIFLLSYLLMSLLPYFSASGAVLVLGLQAAVMALAGEIETSLMPAISVGRILGPVLIGCLYPFCGWSTWWLMAAVAMVGARGASPEKEGGEGDGEDLEAARK